MAYDTRQHHYLTALIDSGCTASAIDRSFVEKNKINTQKVAKPAPVYNADGTKNNGGEITDFVELCMTIGGHQERISFMVTNIRSHSIFLGSDWLLRHNPEIDWDKKEVSFSRCPKDCGKEFEPLLRNEERLFYLDEKSQWEYIRAHSNISTDLAAAAEAKKQHKHWKEVIPSCYHPFE
jgi:hypothetical protein